QFLPQDSTRPQLEYASSDYDIRHRFTLSLTYAIPGRKSFAQMLEGWQLNSVVTLQTAQPWTVNDTVDNIDGTNENAGRWDFFGNPSDFTSGPNPIPYFSANSNPTCAAKALALDGGNQLGPATSSLGSFGCYAQKHSIIIPPALGSFGTMRRNMFRDSGFRDWDFSVTKDWRFQERLT